MGSQISKVLIKFQGIIEQIDDTQFMATTNEVFLTEDFNWKPKKGTSEMLTCPISNIPEELRSLIQEGRLFYLTIGLKSGEEDTENYIQEYDFYQGKDLTPEDIEQANKRANDLFKNLKWE